MKKKSFKKIIVSMAVCLTLIVGIAATSFAFFDPEVSTKGNLIIEEAGTYVLQGTMHGTVYVNPGAGDVFLVLDNVVIDGGETSAIIAESGDSLNISIANNTVNMISGMGHDDDYKAAIYSKADVNFSGSGTLIVNGMDRMGIRAENADIAFNSGEYRIICGMDGVMADGTQCGAINYNGGKLLVNDELIFEKEVPAQTAQTIANADYAAQNNAAADAQNNAWTAGQTGTYSEAAALPEGEDSFGGESAGQEAPVNQAAAGTAASGSQQSFAPDNTNNSSNQYGKNTDTNAAYNQSSANNNQSGTTYGPGMNNQSGTTYGPDMNSGMMPGMQNMASTLTSAESAGEIVESTAENSAASLEPDYENATYITMSDDNNQVSISDSGTYVVTGSSSDGNIVVKKGTTAVVLVLDDLDLTSTTGATLSVNKNSEVKIIVSGDVTLTDAENPEDEDSTDEEVADAFDGAAMKFKDGSSVYITGDGTLTLNGDAKNGIKAGDESVLTIDGEDLTINIDAENDGINSNYDVNILDGTLNIEAADDAIHADHILTIGEEDGTGPDINITESTEGIEATVINVEGGDIDIVSSDDAINAANGDGIYEGVLDYSYNQTGGTVTINSQGDGIDSNGNVNLIDGTAVINSSTAAGEAGIDYDGQLYVSDEFELYNSTGVSGADGMGMGEMFAGESSGQQAMGEMPGDMFSQNGTQSFPQNGTQDSSQSFPQNGTQDSSQSFPQGDSQGSSSGQQAMNEVPGR